MDMKTGDILGKLSGDFSVASNASIYKQLRDAVEEWTREARSWIIKNNPYQPYEEALDAAQEDLRRGNFSVQSIAQDLQQYERHAELAKVKAEDSDVFRNYIQELDPVEYEQNMFPAVKSPGESGEVAEITTKGEVDEIPEMKLAEEAEKMTSIMSAKMLEKEKKKKEDAKALRQLLHEKWKILSDKVSNKWEIDEIEKRRKELLEKLEYRLTLLQDIEDVINQLSLEPGLLFDLSKGDISLSDIEQLKRWAEYINDSPNVKELCDMLGRMRRMEKARHQELIRNVFYTSEYLPDINSKEEIVGVCLGKDIKYALPQS